MNVTGEAMRLLGDDRKAVPLDWSHTYEQRRLYVERELHAARAAGHAKWYGARVEGPYASSSSDGVRSWSDDRIARYALRDAQKWTEKAINIHNENVVRASARGRTR